MQTLHEPPHEPVATAPAGGERPLREALSALFDGECAAAEAAEVTRTYAGSTALQSDWRDYQWLGDALRAAESGRVTAPADGAFVSAVMARLAQEPVPALSHAPAPVTPVQLEASAVATAANDAVFRWKMVAGVAALAAVAAVAWQVAVAPAPTAMPQLAQQTAPATVAVQRVVTERGVMLRDPQLEELMAAHRQYGGVSALQMPAGFLRNATYETPQR